MIARIPSPTRICALLLCAAVSTGCAAPRSAAEVEHDWQQALKTKDLPALERLLAEGADPTWTAEGGRTALMFAAEGGDLGLVDKLLAAGAPVDAVNRYHGNALMFAAKGGDVPVTRRLIAAGADVNHVADLGWTALLVAAAKGNADVALVLIERGADANARDKNGWTPLMHAVSGRHLRAVAALLDVPAVKPDLREESGSTALHIAALGGNDEAVRLLVEHGADVGARTAEGYTPAEVAAAAHHPALADWLEQAAARR